MTLSPDKEETQLQLIRSVVKQYQQLQVQKIRETEKHEEIINDYQLFMKNTWERVQKCSSGITVQVKEKVDDTESQSSSDSSAVMRDREDPNNNAKEKITPRKKKYDTWRTRFLELIQFKEKHGHCLIPYHYPEHQALAVWVKKQRYDYKQYLKLERDHTVNTRTSMTEERIQKLTSIGFVWDSHEAKWAQMFRELLKYKERHGNCNVRAKYPPNPQLGLWVVRQRVLRRELGVKHSPTFLKRVKMLDSIGFQW